jgi:hypothetical protein
MPKMYNARGLVKSGGNLDLFFKIAIPVDIINSI